MTNVFLNNKTIQTCEKQTNLKDLCNLHSNETKKTTNQLLSNTAYNGKIACLINLGCKVNKYEIDALGNILKKNGYKTIYELGFADVYVINTCAVTNESEKKSRQYISKLNKLNPNCKIVVMGCASENNAKQFMGKNNVFSILGNFEKSKIVNYIEHAVNTKIKQNESYEILDVPENTKTRAYLKVQDGCNNFCSYCLIPYVRGRSRSRDLENAVKEAYDLSVVAKEIVVTGIDLSSYKINNELALGTLMKELGSVPSQIRLGSLEVNVITKEFLNTLSHMPNFRQQFHLSLQSGSNSVLKRMNRHYTKEEYLQKVDLIKNVFPNANITTDVIVGFPEETESEFLETCETIKKAGFGNIHIFPYSKRNGTKACTLKMVDGNIIKERECILKQIKHELSLNYIRKNLGNSEKLLIEELINLNGKMYATGYTGNYIKTYVETTNTKLVNELVNVKFQKEFLDGVIAQIKQ